MKKIIFILLFILLSCSQAFATVTYVAYTSGNTAGFGTEVSANKPTGTIDDDVMVAYLSSAVYFAQIADTFACSGWTQIFEITETTGDDKCLAVFYKVASSEGASYTFTHSYGIASLTISTYRGVDTADVLDTAWVKANHYIGYSNDATPASPNITTDIAGSMIIVGVSGNGSNAGYAVTPPSGYTERFDIGDATKQQAIATKSKLTAGSDTPGDWTGSDWNNVDASCWIIALTSAEEPDLGPWSITSQVDLKIEIESFADSIRGLGKNLIWEDQFEDDLTLWTDLSNGGTVELLSGFNDSWNYCRNYNSLHLVSTADYHADVERAFTVESTDDWIAEFELTYASGDYGSVEILNSDDDQLVLFEFGTPAADTAYFSTDMGTVTSTLAFPDAQGNGKQCIISYDHTTESVCCFISGASGDDFVLGQIGDAKEITPATSLKIRFTAPAGTQNRIYIGRVMIYHPQLLLLGGSITQGIYLWVNSPEFTLGRNDYTAPFSYQLSKMYSQCWMGNRAFGGSNAAGAISVGALTNLLKEKPTHVYISYDHNGILAGRSFAQVQGYLTTMIDQVHAAGITGKNLIMGNCVATDYLSSESMQTIRDQENAWLREIQAEEGFTLLDLYTLLVDPADPDAVNPLVAAGDGVHLLELGHTWIAEELYLLMEDPGGWWYNMLVF